MPGVQMYQDADGAKLLFADEDGEVFSEANRLAISVADGCQWLLMPWKLDYDQVAPFICSNPSNQIRSRMKARSNCFFHFSPSNFLCFRVYLLLSQGERRLR